MSNITNFHISQTYRGYGIFYKVSDKEFFKGDVKPSFCRKEQLTKECTETLLECVKENDITEAAFIIRGQTFPIDFSLLKENGVKINYIYDATPIPHNGVKATKWGRVHMKSQRR